MKNYKIAIGYDRKQKEVGLDKADIIIKLVHKRKDDHEKTVRAIQFYKVIESTTPYRLEKITPISDDDFAVLKHHNDSAFISNDNKHVVARLKKVREELNALQKMQEVHSKANPVESFFQIDLISNYYQDDENNPRKRTTRQRVLTGVAVFFTIIFALTCVLSAGAGAALLLQVLLGFGGIAIGMPLAFLIGVLALGVVSGIVNFRLNLKPCMQAFQDIFGGIKSWSKNITADSNGNQMTTGRKFALFGVGVLALVAGITAGALWFLAAYSVLPAIGLAMPVVLGIGISFAIFHAIAVGLLIFKSSQSFVADPKITSPFKKIGKYFSGLKERIRKNVEKGFENDEEFNAIDDPAEKEARIDSKTGHLFRLAIAISIGIVALVTLGLVMMIFFSARSGLTELIGLIPGLSAGAVSSFIDRRLGSGSSWFRLRNVLIHGNRL